MGFHHPGGGIGWSLPQNGKLKCCFRFQAVLLTETLALNFPQESSAAAIPLSQRSVQLLVVRPGELKSRPNIPFHPGLQNTLGMEMTVPFDYPAGPGRLVL